MMATRVKRQSGFSLIEVLVTIVVVALGLLGFAGLQAYSLKSNRAALQRSYATMLAYDIADCMRVNRTNALAGAYNLTFTTPATAGTVAGDDMVLWKAALAGNLPNGQGQITNPIGRPNNYFLIEIRWAENIDNARTIPPFQTEISI